MVVVECFFLDHKIIYMKIRILLFLVWLFSYQMWGQTPFTATYTFGTNGNVTSFNYDGSSIIGVDMGPMLKVGITSTSSSGNFRGDQWSLGAINGSDTFTGSVDTNKYIGFTMAATDGYVFTVTSITFGIGRSSTGIRQSEWRGSHDSYGNSINNYTNLNTGLTNNNGVLTNPDTEVNWTGNILDVSPNYTDITSAGFRLFMYNAEGNGGTAGLQGPITITGTYRPAVTYYTLTYNGNGNTGGAAPLATSYAEGATVVLPDAATLVRTGYTFGGWNTEVSGTGTNYNEGANYTMPAANTTLYAKWECPLTPNGTIEFMADPSCNSNTWLTYQHGTNQPQDGVTYYWQTSPTGENIDFQANEPFTAATNGQDYYVRAFNGECWSTGALQIQNPLIFNPVIASISPLSGAPVGTEITITLVGNYFTTNNDYLVDFGSEIVTATAISATQLKVTIPEGATGGFALETNLTCEVVTDYKVINTDNSGCE